MTVGNQPASGKRVAGGLLLLLALASVAWLLSVKARKQTRELEVTSSAI